MFSAEQIAVLRSPLHPSRVANRNVSGQQQSYLQSWDVRAHLIRLFGFGNFDILTHSCDLMFQRDVEVGQQKKPGWEVAYRAHVELRVRGPVGIDGFSTDCSYSEFAVGSATGAVGLADLHDNAAKSAVSDAMKRCAINLGTQFGLSLYDNGRTSDVVKKIVGEDPPEDTLSPEQNQMLTESLGATPVEQEPAAGMVVGSDGSAGDDRATD